VVEYKQSLVNKSNNVVIVVDAFLKKRTIVNES